MSIFAMPGIKHGQALAQARRVVTVPVVLVILSAVLVWATTGAAAGAPKGESRKIEWSQTGIGANITQDDGSMLLVASVENSVDGPGAAVSEITLDGNTGTGAATRYTAKGVAKGEEEFTLGAPDAEGLIPFEGSGKCVKGGTRVHKNEKCTYTFTGTLDPETNVVNFEITGTSTRRR